MDMISIFSPPGAEVISRATSLCRSSRPSLGMRVQLQEVFGQSGLVTTWHSVRAARQQALAHSAGVSGHYDTSTTSLREGRPASGTASIRPTCMGGGVASAGQPLDFDAGSTGLRQRQQHERGEHFPLLLSVPLPGDGTAGRRSSRPGTSLVTGVVQRQPRYPPRRASVPDVERNTFQSRHRYAASNSNRQNIRDHRRRLRHLNA